MEPHSIILWAVPFYAGLILFEVGWMLLKNLKLYSLRETFSNIGCGAVQQVFDASVNLAMLPLYGMMLKQVAFFDLTLAPINILALFVLKDFVNYWTHRANHNVNILWAMHLVHHQSKEFNYSVGLRVPVFHYLVDFFQLAIFACLGFQPEHVVIVSVLWTSGQMLGHTRLLKKEVPYLSKVFVTPSHHRVHHGKNKIYINKNYGGVISIWDRLFGTYQPEREDVPVVFGVPDAQYCANPVEANLIGLRHIKARLARAKGMRAKLKVVFGSPAAAPIVAKNKPAVSGRVAQISLTLILGVVSAVFIAKAKTLPEASVVTFSLLLIYLYSKVGRVYEN